ncbi:MAG: GGDEF domain-containing protein [Mogibacterium sp.]|nr:GGDEF domain-containing protein [Mogibacterium sp.]
MASNHGVKLLSAMLWLSLGMSFLFIFLDFSYFSRFKSDYRELDFIVHSDPVAGIANRYSSDSIIEKYLDQPLPDNLGCIMIELTNIRAINNLYGHLAGNKLIRDFSTILKLTAVNLCFVARNGGNKFLVLFEDCTEEKLDLFLARMMQKIDSNNSAPGAHPIEYSYGIAFQAEENCESITELIALSDKRINNPNYKG